MARHIPDAVRFSEKPILRVSIGLIRCSFRIHDEAFRSLIAERYRAFLSNSSDKYDFLVDIRPLSYFLEKESLLPDSSEAKVEVLKSNGTLVISRASMPFQLVLDMATGRGIVRMHRSEFCFDGFLRVLYSLLLAEEDGILLHASAISSKGEGHVFFGVSGSGKSTIAALAGDRQVLTDELALIRLWKGEFRVFGTPFCGDFAQGGLNSHVPLRGLYLLKKDIHSAVSSLSELAAIQEVYRCLFFMGQPLPLLERAFQTCCLLPRKVEVRELHFPKDNSFWECITGVAGSSARNKCG